ncbi:protein of unknown function [Asanoa hainanensis]|uniref:Protein-glutamine gamma-glutamyltransferase-like C-terminal domain-containing protein n=1 Tax=Asanoa hainanensis TaxID=560556 RepID=A0A239I860_9ACTN|nr:DUF4129 domain-containing protein [Asanoa hainanensis]SNS89747.1 protein of unknown function [Asanoa hainanensis]
MDLASLRRWWPLALVVGLLGLAALAAGHSSLQIGQVEAKPAAEQAQGGQEDFSQPVQPSFPPEEEVAAAEPRELPGWLAPAAGVLCAAVVLVVVVLVIWILVRDGLRRLRKRPVKYADPAAPAPDAAQVVAAVEAGLTDLSDTDGDPRRAVIACWLRLEQAAAAAGTPKQVGDSPTDLVARLLHAHQISADVLAALANVYREARYATHTVDDRMRTQARTALQRIRTELTAGIAA